MTEDGTSSERAPGFPEILTALAVYHGLLLLGAILLLVGVLRSLLGLAILGAALMAIGVAIQMGVIRWSFRQRRIALPRTGSAGAEVATPAELDRGADRMCVGCGWRGSSPSEYCPRCHRVLVRPFHSC